jgi:hypothetical protein
MKFSEELFAQTMKDLIPLKSQSRQDFISQIHQKGTPLHDLVASIWKSIYSYYYAHKKIDPDYNISSKEDMLDVMNKICKDKMLQIIKNIIEKFGNSNPSSINVYTLINFLMFLYDVPKDSNIGPTLKRKYKMITKIRRRFLEVGSVASSIQIAPLKASHIIAKGNQI